MKQGQKGGITKQKKKELKLKIAKMIKKTLLTPSQMTSSTLTLFWVV
jgi:hypothetical protein